MKGWLKRLLDFFTGKKESADTPSTVKTEAIDTQTVKPEQAVSKQALPDQADTPGHILIRCQGCEQEQCTVSCGSNALAYILGDLLIEAGKCGSCGRNAAPIPGCITDCRNSAEKLILDIVSIEEKRKNAAENYFDWGFGKRPQAIGVGYGK